MIHLSNISINPEYIVLIRWNVTSKADGTPIQLSVAVYLDHEYVVLGELESHILYLPEESPNARLLREWRDRQLTIMEKLARSGQE